MSQLYLCVGGGLGRQDGVCFGLRFGLPADARSVIAEGLPAGLFGGVLARYLFNVGDRFGDAGGWVVVLRTDRLDVGQ